MHIAYDSISNKSQTITNNIGCYSYSKTFHIFVTKQAVNNVESARMLLIIGM